MWFPTSTSLLPPSPSIGTAQRTLSRAQAFDTLTSMASVAGYRAVIEAVFEFKGFMAGAWVVCSGSFLVARRWLFKI